MNSIYELKLHDSVEISRLGMRIVRVPGGWIYESLDETIAAAVFVPFDNEFMGD